MRNDEEVANGYQRLGREFFLFVCVHYEFFFLYLFSMNERSELLRRDKQKSECQGQQPAAISEPNFAVSLLCGLKLVARIIGYLILVSNSAAAVALQKMHLYLALRVCIRVPHTTLQSKQETYSVLTIRVSQN